MYSFIDIHSHIHGSEYDTDRLELVKELDELGGATITIGTDYEESERARTVAKEYPNVYFCAGIHPVDKRGEIFEYEKLRAIADHPKCVGIGECGLDYYWPAQGEWEHGEETEKERQSKLFKAQVELALDLDLPLMIHGRPSKSDKKDLDIGCPNMDAYLDIISILQEYKKEYGEKLRGNIHFFVGTTTIAQAFLMLGFTMSFTGVITFTQDYDEVIKLLPLSSIQAETDAPYVAPKPYRGKRNESKHVREVIQRIAEIKEIKQTEVKKILLQNAMRVWGV